MLDQLLVQLGRDLRSLEKTEASGPRARRNARNAFKATLREVNKTVDMAYPGPKRKGAPRINWKSKTTEQAAAILRARGFLLKVDVLGMYPARTIFVLRAADKTRRVRVGNGLSVPHYNAGDVHAAAALVLREIPGATEADRLALDKRLARALRAAKGNERRALIAEGQLGRKTP